MNLLQVVVAQIMRDFDPVGVDVRQRRALRRRLYYGKSPNRVWHLDGYDKFKPFGFENRGCTDGDRRYILWLNNLRSNKVPKELCNICVTYLTVTKEIPWKVALIVGWRTFL